MPDVSLNATDAAELAEMLQFLSQWLDRDPGRLGESLAQFVGHPAYGPDELHGDLERFIFLLGGSDGEDLFGPTVEQ
jgi:hypothetical protein